jgi:hypothetical protein
MDSKYVNQLKMQHTYASPGRYMLFSDSYMTIDLWKWHACSWTKPLYPYQGPSGFMGWRVIEGRVSKVHGRDQTLAVYGNGDTGSLWHSPECDSSEFDKMMVHMETLAIVVGVHSQKK